MQKFVQKSIFTFISQYIFSLLSSVITNGGRMAEIPDMALIFIKQYQMCLYIREVLIIWDSSFFYSLPTYVKDISCNVKELKRLLNNFLFLNFFYIGRVFPI